MKCTLILEEADLDFKTLTSNGNKKGEYYKVRMKKLIK
jgi:hypothetical protein